MTSGKQGSNPPEEFTCEFCRKKFNRITTKSKTNYRFCSRACSNKTPSAHPKPPKSRFLRAGYRPCSECGDDRSERKKDTKICIKCFRKSQHVISNPPELVKFLNKYYAQKGGKWVAEQTGYNVNFVRRVAYRCGLTVAKENLNEVMYKDVSKRMTENNPMFKQETRDKVAKYWANHPDEHNNQLEKLMEGHRRIQKDRPTKLELRLFEYLGQLEVKYEPFYLIKPKFIVDAMLENNIVVQVDGDYWHGHPRFVNLTERQLAQQRRDKAQDAYLTRCGYKVIRIWESDLSIEAITEQLNIHN